MPLFLLTIDKAVPVFMILSGYMFAKKAKSDHLSDYYKFSLLKRKFLRFTIPMIGAFCLYIILYLIAGNSLTLLRVFKTIVLGNYGSGAYYYNLMIEFIFVAPVIFIIIHKLDTNGVILIGLLNLIYEVFCSAYCLHSGIYRVLIFRYLLAIALGMFYGKYEERKLAPEVLIKMVIVGIVYILLPYCWNYCYRIFTYSPWGRTSMISVLYVFPVIYILLETFKEHKSSHFIGNAAEKVGRASYHIMYTQMIYYIVRPTFDRSVFDLSTLGYAELIIDILLPIAAGILYERITSCVFTNKKA